MFHEDIPKRLHRGFHFIEHMFYTRPMVGPMTDVTGTLSTLRDRWGAGIVRQGMGVVGTTADRQPTAGREPAVSMGALALAPLPRDAGQGPDGPAGTPATGPGATHASTGFRALDGLIGGLPRQGTVAIVGGPSSGATTLTLRAVAEAQMTGAIAAWLDLPNRFDPLEAAERGVDLRWLVVVRPTRSVDGLRIVGAMLASRSVDLLVLDLPPRMPTDQAGLVRQLAAQARRVGGRVLAIGSGGLTPVIRDALAESSHLRLALAHRDWLRVGREVVGQRVLVTVEKDRAGAPGRATEIEIRYQPDGERGAAIGRLLDADRETGPPGPHVALPPPVHLPRIEPDHRPSPTDALSPSPLEPPAAPARGPVAIAAIRPGRAGRPAVGARERP
jgi:recombination protein RecA